MTTCAKGRRVHRRRRDCRRSNRQTLELAGFEPDHVRQCRSHPGAISADFAGVVVSDIRMPGIDGLQLFATLRSTITTSCVADHRTRRRPTTVATIRDGAYDFITKPYAAAPSFRSLTRALGSFGGSSLEAVDFAREGRASGIDFRAHWHVAAIERAAPEPCGCRLPMPTSTS